MVKKRSSLVPAQQAASQAVLFSPAVQIGKHLLVVFMLDLMDVLAVFSRPKVIAGSYIRTKMEKVFSETSKSINSKTPPPHSAGYPLVRLILEARSPTTAAASRQLHNR